MAMVFDLDKPKVIRTKIRVQNADEHNIDFVFRLIVEDVEYGFKGELTEDSAVVFRIPALRDVIGDVSTQSEYPIRIETVAAERFFQRAWTDSAKFKQVPKLELEEVKEDLEEKRVSGVSVISVEEDPVEKFKKAAKEVLKEKDPDLDIDEKDPEIEVPKFKKFSKFMEHGTLDERSRLKVLLSEAREKNEG
jgi:hypothetical protein